MFRFFLPALTVTIIAWVLLYGLKPKMKRQTWIEIRHSLAAVSIGIGVVLFIIVVFAAIGRVHGIN
jgi:hypothetical protein